MSMYLLPKTTTQTLDKQRRKFLWQGSGLKRKYHLVKWEVVFKSKKKGGLGIKNIRKLNISLLCKWWWKLENEDGLWQTIVRSKYMGGGKVIGTIKNRLDDSPVWLDLLKIRHVYLANRKITVNNGLSTLFWEDSWLKDKSLCTLHPALYDFCLDKFVSVHLVLSKNAQLQFSRWLSPILFDSWLNIVNEVYSYSFNNTRDKVVWKCNKLGYFSTKSTYDALSSNECGQTFVHIWKAKIPYRIKIFMWL